MAPAETSSPSDLLAGAHSAFRQADFGEAEVLARHARERAEVDGDAVRAAEACGWIGAALAQQSRYRDALDELYRAVRELSELGRQELSARALNYIAIVHEELGDFAAALPHYERGLAAARVAADHDLAGRILANLGEGWLNEGDHERAASHLELALGELSSGSEPALEGWVHWALGRLAMKRGELADARRHFDRGIELAVAGGSPRTEAEARTGLGQLLVRLEQAAPALAELTLALALAERVGVRREIFKTRLALAEACEHFGDPATALTHFRVFHQLRAEVFDETARAKMNNLLAERELERERHERELSHLRSVELGSALARLERQAAALERLTLHDDLTGAFNRRHLMTTLPIELERCRRYGAPLSLAILDLDHFKAVNDTFSHAVGDLALAALAGILNAEARDSDIVARFGGEEFAIVFPDTGLEEAGAACERIRRAIECFSWSAIQPGLSSSASIGVAAATDLADAARLLAEADRKLYEAKAAGRNCVRW